MSDSNTLPNNSQDCCLIPLTGKRGEGLYAKVSTHRYAYLSRFHWNYTRDGYAARTEREGNKRRTVLMHREIKGFPQGMDVDHHDGDGLNNTDENLRVATRLDNAANWNKRRKNQTSRYFGVTYNRRTRKWVAQLVRNRKHVHIGSFETEEEAVRARDGAAIAIQGEFARLSAPHLTPIPYQPRSVRTMTSQYLGVSWHKEDRRWVAACRLNGKSVRVGAFLSEEEAARARDAFVLRHGITRTKLNF